MSASRAGIAVSDEQVRDAIQSIPAFQVDGRFDPPRYQLALASQVPAVSPRGFEQQVREGLQQSLMASQVATSAFVTPSQMDRLMNLIGARRAGSRSEEHTAEPQYLKCLMYAVFSLKKIKQKS